MTTKVRKQIYIEPQQETTLKQLAEQTGVSEEEIVRQAIDNHLRSLRRSRPDLEAWERIRAFIDQRMQQGPVPGKRAWRREDLYDR